MDHQGMLTLQELTNLVTAGDVDTVLVGFTDLYGRLMGKRFDATFFVQEAAHSGTHVCDYLLTVDMEMEPVPGYTFANWELGYGDVHLVPDLETLRLLSWQPKTALVLCDVVENQPDHGTDAENGHHALVSVAPRSLLRRQLARAAELGYDVVAASELEYYIFQDSFADAAHSGYRDLTPFGWYLEDYNLLQGTREEPLNAALRRHLSASGIPVENSKGEWGRGQHELNVRYARALTMADRHTVFKQCVKEVADGMGLSVTFMAKPAADQAGSSCHIHLSLWQDGEPLFPGDEELGPVRASSLFRWFLGGWITYAPDVMVFYAPTVNAYKRYQAGSWAPTSLAWSYDNRTAGFRVVGGGKSLRIECRIPGADCNPYLAYAAALASGLAGIQEQIEPPPLFEGDVYAARDLPAVPTSLGQATDAFAASDFAERAFGRSVVEHYTHFFRVEQKQFDNAVTDWERQRYFERI